MKAAKQRLAAFARFETSRNPKLTPRPQYEARVHVIYFDFFFLPFFFFVAMVVTLDVSGEPTARLVQSQAFNLGP